jgi:hypothetical protein
LRIHILSSISNNFIFDKNSLYDFISKTFYGYQSGFSNFSNFEFSNFEQKKLEVIVDFLKKEELIEEKGTDSAPLHLETLCQSYT